MNKEKIQMNMKYDNENIALKKIKLHNRKYASTVYSDTDWICMYYKHLSSDVECHRQSIYIATYS